MDEQIVGVASPPRPPGTVEEAMLGEDMVREIVARLARGEQVKRIARELGVDRKTVKRWRARGGWRPQRRCRRRQLEAFQGFVARRGPEVAS